MVSSFVQKKLKRVVWTKKGNTCFNSLEQTGEFFFFWCVHSSVFFQMFFSFFSFWQHFYSQQHLFKLWEKANECVSFFLLNQGIFFWGGSKIFKKHCFRGQRSEIFGRKKYGVLTTKMLPKANPLFYLWP